MSAEINPNFKKRFTPYITKALAVKPEMKVFRKRIMPRPLRREYRGFTLVEILIAINIVVLIFVMVAAATNFAVGNTGSGKVKLVSQGVRPTIEFISRRISGADYWYKPGGNQNIYGIGITDSGGQVENPSNWSALSDFTGKKLVVVFEKNMISCC